MRSTAIRLASVLCLTWLAPAHALVLCIKKSGVVVQREACKRRETPLNLGQFVVVGPKGDKGEKGDKGDPGTGIPCLSASDNEVFFTGCNVNIRSGSGSTDGAVNGVGNLIIGYNANPDARPRSGSHNLVIGDEHSYVSYGGIVAGHENAITAPSASVTGGDHNKATGNRASVTGGSFGEASGEGASVTGGLANLATGFQAAVSGGRGNLASGYQASVSGGGGNKATSQDGDSSVSGGFGNTASGPATSVSGGESNTATGYSSSVSGGVSLTTTGPYEWHAGQTSGFPDGTQY